MYEPPGILLYEPLEEMEERNLWVSNCSDLRPVPVLKVFREEFGLKSLTQEERVAEVITLGIDSLMVEDIWFNWCTDLVRLLSD